MLKIRKLAPHGWLPDIHDDRDHPFEPVPGHALPQRVDLRPQCPPVFDQGVRIGSCTANAVCNAFRFNLMWHSQTQGFKPSRLFLHYNARAMRGTEKANHGAQIRDAIKSLIQQGVCRESHWPYIAYKFDRKPPLSAYREATAFESLAYKRINQDLLHMRACLAHGHPFVCGLMLYSDFESERMTKTGVLHLPDKKETLVGGHAVLVVGYQERSQRFIIMNSWGDAWGQAGYFSVPYAYLLSRHLASDFWTLRVSANGE